MVETMNTQFAKWGNSLAVRIPKAMAETIAAADGSPAVITVENGALVVRTARVRSYRIDDLVKGITRKNRHPEIATGAPVGREID
jgi:antitoxin MazE